MSSSGPVSARSPVDSKLTRCFVGQRKLSVTADTYTHVLSDGRELGYRKVTR
jgi:hypothetical protein